MKKLFKKSFLVVAAVAALVGVSACDKTEGPTESEVQLSYKDYLLVDLADVLSSVGNLDKLSATTKEAVTKAYNDGVAKITNAATDQEAYGLFDEAKASIISALPKANGVLSYNELEQGQKTEILGVLEAYAVRNGITGISLFENGGYVMYHERVQLGTETYIPGYGFGALAEGNVTADLESETNAAWKRYYHTYDSSDPGTANYLNDKGSQVSSIYGYMGGSYFTTFMNSTKDGYDWVPELADAKPTALNAPEGQDYATKWTFPVKTTGLKYTTNSTIASRAAFNNREVVIEDYITPFQLLLTQANGYARGAEMATASTGAIKGAKEYYNASKEGFNAEAWANVGVKAYVDEDGQGWFEYEFTAPVTSFYAMYYITSSLYQPIPQSFIDLVGVKNYLGYNENKTETPVDNGLALGSYALEAWVTDQEIVFKKNPNYVFASTKYAAPGVHIDILTALQSDPNAGIKEFELGNVDSAGIPQEYLEKYKNDPRTRQTTGDSNFKLNVNATDAATWEYLFGENGVVCQTPKSEYWVVEPALSNPHFVKALSLSIDRVTFADKRGSIASVDYLSSNYMSDPVNGISYSTTQAHKDAVAGLLRDTDGCGYSLEMAREYFKIALDELIWDGAYTAGTAENPTLIELEIAWMYPTQEDQYHKEIEQFLETAFNHESVYGNQFKLDVTFEVGATWDHVYYEKLMVGQYDLGFGSISGNSLNPLDFLSVLSSDQNISGQFTLNWGTDTNDANADVLVYEGMQWSFDALWMAANATAIVKDGKLVSIYAGSELVSETANADGTETVVIDVKFNNGSDYSGQVEDLLLMGCNDTDEYSDYNEISVFEQATAETLEDGTVRYTIVLTAEQVAAFKELAMVGIDVYTSETIQGETSQPKFTATVYTWGSK